MNRITALQQKHAETLKALEAINVEADGNAENPGVLSAEQEARYAPLKATLEKYAASITEAKALAEHEKIAPAARTVKGDGTGVVVDVRERADADKDRRGFRTPREFFTAVLENSGLRDRADVTDERLRSLAVYDKDDKKAAAELAYMLPLAYTPRGLKATVGSDEQGEYDDRYGGFAITPTRLPGMMGVGFEGDPTAGRTQAIPMQTVSVEIEARTDKNHTTSVSGGFTVARRAEAAAATASRGQMELITLKAASLFGLNYTTEELLADSPQTVIALVQRGFETQFPAHMLNEKLRGLGGDQYVGVISAACTVSVAKETGQAAASIYAKNVIKMAARCWGLDNAIWLANHDTRPDLMGLQLPTGTTGALMYQPSAAVGFPDMLLGRPIFYTEFCATLGTVGDLILANFSQYLDGLYQPLQSAESMHVRFANHERAFKFWLRNAGAPWWRTALTPNQSSSTLSPFVTLATRA